MGCWYPARTKPSNKCGKKSVKIFRKLTEQDGENNMVCSVCFGLQFFVCVFLKKTYVYIHIFNNLYIMEKCLLVFTPQH